MYTQIMDGRDLESLLRRYSKPAYFTQLTAGEPSGSAASKFGGQPYFESGEEWPICTKCKQPEYFICQLDVRECPATNLSDYFGLLSFFYCWKCFPWDPEQSGWSLINHAEAADERSVNVPMPALAPQGFLSKLFGNRTEQTSPCCVELVLFDCYPQIDEFEEIGGAEAKQLLSADDAADLYYDTLEKLSGRKSGYDTLVGGYAEWIQPMPEMKCGQCGNWQRQLMQVGSESRANLMFGDAGAMYFYFCESHPEVKMSSQCF